jgi:hypothetical protein
MFSSQSITYEIQIMAATWYNVQHFDKQHMKQHNVTETNNYRSHLVVCFSRNKGVVIMQSCDVEISEDVFCRDECYVDAAGSDEMTNMNR